MCYFFPRGKLDYYTTSSPSLSIPFLHFFVDLLKIYINPYFAIVFMHQTYTSILILTIICVIIYHIEKLREYTSHNLHTLYIYF